MQQPPVSQAWKSVFLGFPLPSQERQFSNFQWQQQRRFLAWVQLVYCGCILGFLLFTGLLLEGWQQANWQASLGLACWLLSQLILTWCSLQIVKARVAHCLFAVLTLQHFVLMAVLMSSEILLSISAPSWLVFSLPVLLMLFYMPFFLALLVLLVASSYSFVAANSLHIETQSDWFNSELVNTSLIYALLALLIGLSHNLRRFRYTYEQGIDLCNDKAEVSTGASSLEHSSSDTDELTGYANFVRFRQFSEIEIERSSRYQNAYSILLINVNHFSVYRDKLGSDDANQLLVKLANFLQSKIRKVDLLARCDNDQFVIGLPESSLYQALDTAERIHDALNSEFWEIFPDDLDLGSRLGVACIDGTTNTIDQLMAKAENAMNNHRSASALSYGR
ncbi:GGDEF domain-containing protein [Agarivorans sp. 1_MG-2023]|uniref:GGDEF domain-containing protein n=1 Tax=Agarivorans sp. 1_MG-2023 TaxID=3062634 RepID=UPI0026E2AF13|nr:GGDEF domain-containing protein [Agarivorans sp. 1_MG-2023]MDO6761951.1 GGDEF domain-containing protein [Agarivorans sp. 1_MG-2023]